jgi:hypothetical protein
MSIIMLFLAVIVFPLGGESIPTQHKPSVIPARAPENVSIYEVAEMITGAPAEILRGIAFAESSGGRNMNHPDPLDVGVFGLHESASYHQERTKKWGEYDASNPQQAAIIAGHLYRENLKLLGNSDLAIAAHMQGPTGVRRNGACTWYIARVRGAS